MIAGTDEEYVAGIHRVHEEAGGLRNVYIVDATSCAKLLLDGLIGDNKALALYGALVPSAQQITSAPRRSPKLCMCSPRAIKRVARGIVFGLAVPATDKPENAVGFVFCPRCAADEATLMVEAATGLKRLWPDLRPIVVTHPHGGVREMGEARRRKAAGTYPDQLTPVEDFRVPQGKLAITFDVEGTAPVTCIIEPET